MACSLPRVLLFCFNPTSFDTVPIVLLDLIVTTTRLDLDSGLQADRFRFQNQSRIRLLLLEKERCVIVYSPKKATTARLTALAVFFPFPIDQKKGPWMKL